MNNIDMIISPESWFALFGEGDEFEAIPLVCWALTEGQVVPMVMSDSKVVAASTLEGYNDCVPEEVAIEMMVGDDDADDDADDDES